MNDDSKIIVKQMLESGMSQEDIIKFFLETFDIDLSEESTFLLDNTTECYSRVRR